MVVSGFVFADENLGGFSICLGSDRSRNSRSSTFPDRATMTNVLGCTFPGHESSCKIRFAIPVLPYMMACRSGVPFLKNGSAPLSMRMSNISTFPDMAAMIIGLGDLTSKLAPASMSMLTISVLF